MSLRFETAAMVELLPEDITVEVAGVEIEGLPTGNINAVEYEVAQIGDLGAGGTFSYIRWPSIGTWR